MPSLRSISIPSISISKILFLGTELSCSGLKSTQQWRHSSDVITHNYLYSRVACVLGSFQRSTSLLGNCLGFAWLRWVKRCITWSGNAPLPILCCKSIITICLVLSRISFTCDFWEESNSRRMRGEFYLQLYQISSCANKNEFQHSLKDEVFIVSYYDNFI